MDCVKTRMQKIDTFLSVLDPKNARKLGKLAKFCFGGPRTEKILRKKTKIRSSEIQKFSKENVDMFWWSANRDKICQVDRESEKVENRCYRRSWDLQVTIG